MIPLKPCYTKSMLPPQPQISLSHGFTLIEILTALAVLVITLTTTLTFIFAVHEKSTLSYHTDALIKTANYARQQSIRAYQGQTYQLQLTPPHSYSILPENKLSYLPSSIFLDLDEPLIITFSKVTGHPDHEYSFNLRTNSLFTTIFFNSLGIISSSPPSKL